MGKIYHSCGHEDFHRPVSGWPLVTKDYDTLSDGTYGKVITNSTVCIYCYLGYVKKYPETVVFDDWEKEEWFG